MQALIQRASSGAHTRQIPRTDPGASDTVTRRLAAEFPGLAPSAVERCVVDTWICAEHLGLEVTAGLVECVAREHLLGVQNSVPPSGARDTRGSHAGASRGWSQYIDSPAGGGIGTAGGVPVGGVGTALR